VKAREAIDLLAQHRGDAVAVCALGMAANEWWAATKSEDSFYMHGAMGFAASFALGLALALPQAPVWLINADGSLCMNLGCLLTEASQAAKNLKHFVVDNGVYQTVGGLPVVNDGRTDYAAIARGAGFSRVRAIEGLDDLRRQLPGIVTEDGPSFTVLRVESETGFLRTPPMTYEGPEMKYRFGRALERRFGIEVFGPQGY
jgi:sulfopyruvate decarboxylase subunit beta